ncbi:MAG: sigma-70 family RNA polymerase sigma factor [Gemmatimonadaceae bacterium]
MGLRIESILRRTERVNPSPNDSAEQRALIQRARAGSPDALGELYALYAPRVMAVAFRLTASVHDAEDVLHDVFLGLPEALARSYEEGGRFDAWLRQLAARTALTRLRASGRRREVAIASDVAAPAPGAERLGDRVALARALAQLPDSLRTVFVLKSVEGYTHAEVAAMLGITEGASEVRLVRAVKRLRELLGGVA